jgi:hypothetical protein
MYVVAIVVQRRRHLLTLSVHRFELSSRLIGVYKVANQTRSVAIGASTRSLRRTLLTRRLQTIEISQW